MGGVFSLDVMVGEGMVDGSYAWEVFSTPSMTLLVLVLIIKEVPLFFYFTRVVPTTVPSADSWIKSLS